MPLLSALFLGVLATLSSSLPHAGFRRDVSQLRENYDFVIVGAGTAGLTVADRLTEAFPSSRVLCDLIMVILFSLSDSSIRDVARYRVW
jgi:choline dehydrogenase